VYVGRGNLEGTLSVFGNSISVAGSFTILLSTGASRLIAGEKAATAEPTAATTIPTVATALERGGRLGVVLGRKYELKVKSLNIVGGIVTGQSERALTIQGAWVTYAWRGRVALPNI